jgi:hypothetical protein
MRYFVLIFIFGCQSITAQTESEDVKKDREFLELMSKVDDNTKASFKVQHEASEEQTKIVNETIKTIVDLKKENEDLKAELNETKGKLDSANTDTLLPFVISPISNKKDF